MRTRALNKKGEGLVTTTVIGTGALIVSVIVLLTITTTLFNADLFAENKRVTTAINESIGPLNSSQWVTFGNYTLPQATVVINAMKSLNGTTLAGNYTVDSNGSVIFKPGTVAAWNESLVFINSTTTYAGIEEAAARDTSGNLSAGLDNISEKIPTILLIVAVVFLLGALVLLVRNANQMGITQSGGSL